MIHHMMQDRRYRAAHNQAGPASVHPLRTHLGVCPGPAA